MYRPFGNRALVPMALAAALATTSFQYAAFAKSSPAPTHRTVAVSTSGLDLSLPADVQRLDARLASAARAVCSPNDRRNLTELGRTASCQEKALASAAAKRNQIVAAKQAERLAAGNPDRTNSVN